MLKLALGKLGKKDRVLTRRPGYGRGRILLYGTGKKKEEKPADAIAKLKAAAIMHGTVLHVDVLNESDEEVKLHLSEIAATRKRYMKTQRQINSLRKKTDALLAKLP